MDTRNARILLATLGFIGIVALSASFAINPGPPAGATLPQIMVWGKQNQVLIEVGAWLQVFGSFLQLMLILGVLYITDTFKRFIGIITACAVLLIMGISLVESSFYLNAIAGGLNGDMATLNMSLNLIKSIQHAYSMIPAPALNAGLGVVILTSPLFSGIFGRILGYLGVAFGVVLLVLGFIGTFTPLQVVIDNVLTVQQVWFIAITIAVALSARRAQSNAIVKSEPAIPVALSK